jgi:predicted GIY-YIG superfamily endonuclease
VGHRREPERGGVSAVEEKRTGVYRIRGEGAELLYIGMTNNLVVRWNSHAAIQSWWDEVRSLTIEWYDTRQEAADVEKSAILAEQPKYNVTYLRSARAPGRRKTGAVLVDWENFELEPEDDDEDLISLGDVASMIRNFDSATKAALLNTGGPRGFKLAGKHLFRKGQIMRWIYAVEASQQGESQMDEEPDASDGERTAGAA